MKNTEITVNEALALVDQLNGPEAVRAVLQGWSIEPLEQGNITLGQAIAAVSKLGGVENFLRLLSAYKLEIVWREGEGEGQIPTVSAVITELPAPLFDSSGRRIPPKGLQAAVCDPNRSFRLKQPTYLRLAVRYCRFEGTGMVPFLSVAEFEGRGKDLLKQLYENKLTANLLSGVHLPIIVPHIVTPPEQVGDYGEMLEEFVLAAEKSYRRQYSDRSFTNYRKGELAKQTAIVPGSRHEQLIARMASGTVVGIYFPNALLGFSVDAQREQMATLPEGFLLAGGIDTAMGWVMYPDILARDNNTPYYDCSALQWRSSDYSLCFRGDGDGANFSEGGYLKDAFDRYSGGLLFIGPA